MLIHTHYFLSVAGFIAGASTTLNPTVMLKSKSKGMLFLEAFLNVLK